MDERFAGLFNDSFSRCLADVDFMNKFYGAFMASSPEIRDKFKNTDFTRQQKMLERSLYAIVASSEENYASDEYLVGLVARHRAMNIKPEYYDIWLSCLVDAASRSDPEFDENIRRAWQAVLQRGVDLMKHG